MYSTEVVACACIGGLAVTALAVGTYVHLHRRSQRKASSHSDDEEADIGTATVTAASDDTCNAPNVAVVPDESQPLLSESAIRTRYTSNPNEFARSYIDRTQPSSYLASRSLALAPESPQFAPIEHVVALVPSDLSDSDDSSIDSSIAEVATPPLEQGVSRDQLSESYAEAVASVLTTVTIPDNNAADDVDSHHPSETIEKTPADSVVEVSVDDANEVMPEELVEQQQQQQPDEDPAVPDDCQSQSGIVESQGTSIQEDDAASSHVAEHEGSAADEPVSDKADPVSEEPEKDDNEGNSRSRSASQNETDVPANVTDNEAVDAKPSALHTATVELGRPRSSTLNTMAKEFIPGKLTHSNHQRVTEPSAVPADSHATGNEAASSAASVANTDATVPIEAKDGQTQALGHSVSNTGSTASTRSRQHSTASSKKSLRSDATEKTSESSKDADPSEQTTADLVLDEEEPITASCGSIKRRCRFWPTCSNRNCKYVHPSQTCRMYPECAFDTACIYIHPSDVQKINSVISRPNKEPSRRSKRKNQDIIRMNNLSSFVK
ncbi:hypothetical protein LPJ53_000992 [Coemansia erecta]|uniref:C3H1-type domain-containing protein n=1 Tax=Coemansia erecta TaxID=147472 RepID=A0A9W7Y7E8_9FUNG|nr:hypothetical protein LPJ53_000992 [Coemansia erecta]